MRRAEPDIEALVAVRMLMQQEAEVGRGPVGGRDGEQHGMVYPAGGVPTSRTPASPRTMEAKSAFACDKTIALSGNGKRPGALARAPAMKASSTRERAVTSLSTASAFLATNWA